MIPKTYEEWLFCITKRCNVKLSHSYIQARLDALNNKSNKDTLRIIILYGHQHHENLKLLFNQALGQNL